MDYKKSNTPTSTITRDVSSMSTKVGNVYETVAIIAKRATQINSELKLEITSKLQDFPGYGDSIDEIFENREQIEISKYYEKIPKPTLLATEEFLDDKIYYRNPLKEKISQD
ncbi:MAG: DNA-directed RNA polymerase subunit omega [Prevotellaceae bacterium]|jgi:DNA-directed RNA polymerase subunit K/omega|nr:DNA-directed RNA polymerase subunit omega [Prevotellaceae bacterium]